MKKRLRRPVEARRFPFFVAVVSGALLLVAAFFVFSKTAPQTSALYENFPQWTQKTGEVLSAPACGSGTPSTTCDANNKPVVSVTLSDLTGHCSSNSYDFGIIRESDWNSIDTGVIGSSNESYGTNFGCAGGPITFTWSAGTSATPPLANTAYHWWVAPVNGNYKDILVADGSIGFTPNCAPPPAANNSSCGAVSAPASVVAGQNFSASATVNNIGTKQWKTLAPSASHQLVAVTSPGVWAGALWGLGGYDLPYTPVGSDQSATFHITATAPSAPGTYNFSWQMIEQGVEFFGPVCSSAKPITVTAPPDTASCVVTNKPASIAPNTRFTATVQVTNTGGATWTHPGGSILAIGDYFLAGSIGDDWDTKWNPGGQATVMPVASMAPGAVQNFTVNATSPATAGAQSFNFQMQKYGQTWLPAMCSSNITVTPAPAPSVDIKANGSDGPITISANTAATISWTSANMANDSSCTVSPTGWTGTSNAGISTGNLFATKIYAINCNGSNGPASDSVTVNVSAVITVNAPTVSNACTGDGASKVNISWDAGATGSGYDPSSGYFVDIDNDNNWGNGFWNKSVSQGTTNTGAPTGFNGVFGQTGALTLTAGNPYQVRVYYAKSDSHSPDGSFIAPSCTGAPSCTLSINPPTGDAGAPMTFSWTSQNDADGEIPMDCTGTMGKSTQIGASGASGSFGRPTDTQTCTMTVQNNAGETNTCAATVAVNLSGGDPFCSISPSFITGAPGTTVMATFTTINDKDFSLPFSCTGSWESGTVDVDNGSEVYGLELPTDGQTCTFTAENNAGKSSTCQLEVSPSSDTTLSASISANPSSGAAPLNGVDLAATVSGTETGTMNYTFYCNRSDAGTNVTGPGIPSWNAKYDATDENPKTAIDVCNYSAAGTYTAKVIVERGTSVVEKRKTITVSQPGPAPTVAIFANGVSGTIFLSAPASYIITWDTTHTEDVGSCVATGSWSSFWNGDMPSGSQIFSNVGAGAYTYGLFCTNDGGSVSGAVGVNVSSIREVNP